MEYKKDLTKRLIAEGFKELVKKSSFEKLTIKTISDEAGIIRPTFYNYYRDKYDVIEWILQTEVLDGAIELLEKGDLRGGLCYILRQIMQEKEYYKKIFQITGQNSFEEVMQDKLTAYIQGIIIQRGEKKLWPANPALTPYTVARHEAYSFVGYVKYWVMESSTEATIEEIVDGYLFLRKEMFKYD